MKRLVNDVHAIVCETLEGFAPAHPDPVDVYYSPDFVTRHVPKAEGKAGPAFGGRSGHEPLHVGLVGGGMLDTAMPDAVFTSPTLDPILEATRAADHGTGALHTVKNYMGDVLNFETAAELADMEGIKVSSAVVSDDVAVKDFLYTVGRRGAAGTIFVEKIAGAATERGDSLEEVTRIATKVNDQTRSVGLVLSPCTMLHVGEPSFDLGEDKAELGIGIHGEPEYRRGAMETADSLVAELYERVREDLGLVEGERVTALVNGMGGTPVSELYICFRALAALLEKDGTKVVRQMASNYVINLEMPGVSVTLMHADGELLEFSDASVNTVTWK